MTKTQREAAIDRLADKEWREKLITVGVPVGANFRSKYEALTDDELTALLLAGKND